MALVNENKVTGFKPLENHQDDSLLMPTLEQLLKESKLTLKDLTHIAAVTGPGGFMSLRVGISLANALSWSLKIPLAGVHLSDLYETRGTTPTPNPSPWPFVAYATSGQQGEGKFQNGFNKLLGRVWRGVNCEMRPAHAMLKRARAMRSQPTETEKLLWNHLRKGQLNGLHFRRQRPIGNFVVDFYCESLKLAVEVDGGIHNDTHEYDEYRTSNLNARGVNVMRFSNNDILHRINDVLTAIRSFNDIPLPRLAGGAAPTASGEGLGEGVWLHSTKKNLLFLRGFGDLQKLWPEPVSIELSKLRQELENYQTSKPPNHQTIPYVGELIDEHRKALPHLHPAKSINPLTDILPAFVQTLKFEMKPLEPWYGREG